MLQQIVLPDSLIEKRIFLIRDQKVMLDVHLAELYDVPTKRLKEQVRRNSERFPADFMFELNAKEDHLLRSQFATSKRGRGGSRYHPFAFTERGVAMLATVLNSKRAILVNIAIMRTFVKLRQLVASHQELSAKLRELERKVGSHDSQIRAIFEAIRQLVRPPDHQKKQIGF